MSKTGSKKTRMVAGFAVVVVFLSLFIISSQRHSIAEAKGNDYDSIELFTDVMAIIKKSYVEEVDTKKLVYGAINGMLSSLDPHSSFMTPETYKEMKIDTKGAFGGLGIEISVKDGVLTVISPIEDTPAFKAGIKAGDMILKIDDKFTKDLNINDAVKRMRGQKGSKVILTIMRDGFDKPKEFPLVRDIIQVKSVRFNLMDGGYGYVRIAQFQEKTDDDLAKALKSMKDEYKKELNGLVLDLRNDPGGLLDQAVKVADHFVQDGKLIVYTEGREKDSKMQFTARKGGKEPNYPIVVVINGGSASASEIVAGALQDHRRAIILGTQSFGKGSVQTIIPLSDDSGLRLTTARYYTPNGRSIQAKGITPDITVEAAELSKAAGKNDSMHLREKDLENHFESDDKSGETGVKKDEKKVDKKDDKADKAPQKLEEALKNDYQVLRALDLLKGWELIKSMDSGK
ncbi:MAG: S41 family peptidase [Desulfuromonadaceae bacterium]|nr:S41 family peptidase [Desulfuromonadaceae bacterium]MDD2846955.1 S41 family peptidase [Desulfuromonadaceae bacterium]MDD4129067.1 S41 family peptidase [Desulfuromonadaceae bacterium]